MCIFDSELSILEKFQILGFIIGVCAFFALCTLLSEILPNILGKIGLFFLSIPNFLWRAE